MDSNREKLPNCNNITLAANVEPLMDFSVINPDNYSNVSVEFALRFYRSKFPKKLIIGHININSIRNKFEILKSMLSEVLDVLMITETKLDDSFPEQQFHIEGFNIPFRLDRNRHGGGLLLYVRNNINAVFLKSYVFPDNLKAFFIEILLKSFKWLICCSYNPNRINVATYLDQIGKGLDTYSRKYKNTLLIGDFNVEPNEANLKIFCNQYKLNSLNKEPTCVKNVNKPSCIDLFLTNNSKCFEDCLTLETGLSDFQKLIVTIMKNFRSSICSKILLLLKSFKKYLWNF